MKILSIELKGYKRLSLNNIQYIKLTPSSKIQFILGTNGSGKAQPLSSPIKTPNGWKTMGDMYVGCPIIAKDGSVTKVTGVHPRGVKDVFCITFTDGRSTRVTLEHLWKVYIGEGNVTNPKVVTTIDIIELLKSTTPIYIDLIDSECNDDTLLPIDPYTLGMDISKLRIPYIPDVYLNGSTMQRLELLRGVMDRYGSIDDDGTMTFTYHNLQYTLDIQYLIRSLGGIAILIEGDTYTLTISIPHKILSTIEEHPVTNLKLQIDNVMLDSRSTVQCITIDHPDRLYVTDDFIVTHNSSLLKELSPLPATHNEFNKDGYKNIVIEHRSSEYRLLSDFRGGKFYSFIKDNKELNPSGTITVYKELVSKEFNITQEVHNLMIGSTLFHDMSVMERRNWFTKICDSDYTYAIKFYNKLRESHRDLVGGIKLSRVRLVQETDKLLSDDKIEALKEDISNLNILLKELIELKTIVPDKSTILSTLERTYNQVATLVRNVGDKRTIYMNNEVLLTEDAIRVQLITLDSELILLQRESDTIYTTLKEQEDLSELLHKSKLDGTDDIDATIDTLTIDISNLKKQIILPIDITDPTIVPEAIKAIDVVRPDLRNICTEIPINSDNEINRIKHKEYHDEHVELKDKYDQLDMKQHADVKRKSEYEHLKTHNQVACPECKHSWSIGYSESKYRSIVTTIEQQAKHLHTLQNRIKELDVILERYGDYFNNLKSLKQTMSLWSVLKPYWEYVIGKEYVFKAPAMIPEDIDVLREDLTIQLTINTKTQELNDLISVKKKLAEEQTLSIVNMSATIKATKDKHYDVNKTLTNKREELTNLRLQLDTLISMNLEIDKLYELGQLVNTNVQHLKDITVQESLNTFINETNVTISRLESKLSKIDSQLTVVDSITTNIAKLEDEEKVVRLAVKELSPTEGLIAKGLKGFINHFVYKLNQFISTIWLYPLEIIPIVDEDSDLDFKFGVKINDGLVINDVKLGSSAMKEIIDLAFRVVSAEYLGLGKAPLFLDEFGLKLDMSHRDSAYYAINELLNTSEFTQVYMISHYSSNYGSFKNSDITILSASNIEIPRDMVFNQNVVIE